MTAEEIREIIPPDLPPNVTLVPSIGSKRKASSPLMSATSPNHYNPSDVLSGSELGALDNCSLGNRTPSPLTDRSSPVDEISQIVKKCLVESEFSFHIHIINELISCFMHVFHSLAGEGIKASPTHVLSSPDDYEGANDSQQEPMNFCKKDEAASADVATLQPEDLSLRSSIHQAINLSTSVSTRTYLRRFLVCP